MTLTLLTALVDVVASQASLLPTMTAMKLCQMIVQADWDSDHPLKQLDLSPIEGVSSIYDFIDLSDENKLAMLEKGDALSIATFCNRYPALDVSSKTDLIPPHSPGQNLQFTFSIRSDYQDDTLLVPSLHYPFKHLESWCILITDANSSIIHSIKRITMTSSNIECFVDVEVPVEAGNMWRGRILIVCDSFVGADQECEVDLLLRS